ncbi:MAG: metallophosphatase family protein [Anaerolineaceae bacterium]|nr:metallophosphatase family protein [Anaerolineaceae bacterium]
MRVLIISDIHSNIVALEAVLYECQDIDKVWCLGDIVGYGPNPNECIECLQGISDLTCIMGNHDAAALGLININAFNHDARRSLEWLSLTLEQKSLDFLRSLPETEIVDGVLLAHGSPRNPIWEYVMDDWVAKLNLSAFETEFCLVGHTHIPVAFSETDHHLVDIHFLTPGSSTIFRTKSIINPGSVGQPRDRDPRASYLIYDTSEGIWENHRVSYDLELVQDRIYAANLPAKHATRLRNGM